MANQPPQEENSNLDELSSALGDMFSALKVVPKSPDIKATSDDPQKSAQPAELTPPPAPVKTGPKLVFEPPKVLQKKPATPEELTESEPPTQAQEAHAEQISHLLSERERHLLKSAINQAEHVVKPPTPVEPTAEPSKPHHHRPHINHPTMTPPVPVEQPKAIESAPVKINDQVDRPAEPVNRQQLTKPVRTPIIPAQSQTVSVDSMGVPAPVSSTVKSHRGRITQAPSPFAPPIDAINANPLGSPQINKPTSPKLTPSSQIASNPAVETELASLRSELGLPELPIEGPSGAERVGSKLGDLSHETIYKAKRTVPKLLPIAIGAGVIIAIVMIYFFVTPVRDLADAAFSFVKIGIDSLTGKGQ